MVFVSIHLMIIEQKTGIVRLPFKLLLLRDKYIDALDEKNEIIKQKDALIDEKDATIKKLQAELSMLRSQNS